MTNNLSGSVVPSDDFQTKSAGDKNLQAQQSVITQRDSPTATQFQNQSSVTNDVGSQPQNAVAHPGNLSTDDQPQAQVKPSLNSMVGSMAKEQFENRVITSGESAPIVELREDEAVPEHVSSWIEKLEQGEDVHLPQQVTDDNQQPLVMPITPTIDEVKIVLPLTEEEMQKGLHQQLFSGARWLAEWCVRLVKKFHGKVIYRSGSMEGRDGLS